MKKKLKKNKLYPERFRKILRDSIDKYRDDLCSNSIDISVHYMDMDNPDRPNIAASMDTDHTYLKGTMKIYPCAVRTWEREGDEDLRETIAHEIAHIATQPMVDLIRNPYKTEDEVREKWEALTTILGRYVYENVKNKS